MTSNRAVLVPGGSHGGNVVYGTAGPGGTASSVEIVGEPDYFEISSALKITQTFQQVTEDRVRLTQTQIDILEVNLKKLLSDKECNGFIQAMLENLPDRAGFTTKYSGSLTDVFNRIKEGGGFWSGDVIRKGALAITDPNVLTMTWDRGRITPLITGEPWQQLGTAVYLIHELTHVFTATPNSGAYGHEQMAQAASAAAALRKMDLSKDLNLSLPSRGQFASGEEYDQALSDYFNRVVGYACRKVKL